MKRAKTGLPENWIAMVARCRPEHVERLSELRGSLAILEIFEEVFPSEYARVRASRFTIDSDSGLYSGVSRFFSLVSSRLFPLWDTLEYGEFDLGSIPFVPMFDFQGIEEDPAFYGSALAIAFGLLGNSSYPDDGDGIVDCPIVEHVHALGPASPAAINFEALFEKAARLRTPLRHLPLALEVVDHATPNAFLRGPCECGSCGLIPWSAENVRSLAVEHREARAGLRKLDRLARWLDADREARVPEAVRLWNACAKTNATALRRSHGEPDVAAA